MQEDIGESRDGGGRKRRFREVPLLGGGAAWRGLPADGAGGIATAGCTCGAPRSPVGGTRASPSVNLPDHSKCHTARSPSMGTIGKIRVAAHRVTVRSARVPPTSVGGPATPVTRRQVPSPGYQAGLPERAAGLRDERGPRQHRHIATALFSPWIMVMQIDGRSRVPGATAPAQDPPPHSGNTCSPAPPALRQPCRRHSGVSGKSSVGAVQRLSNRVAGTSRPFPSSDTM